MGAIPLAGGRVLTRRSWCLGKDPAQPPVAEGCVEWDLGGNPGRSALRPIEDAAGV